jgi:hypothetical protein
LTVDGKYSVCFSPLISNVSEPGGGDANILACAGGSMISSTALPDGGRLNSLCLDTPLADGFFATRRLPDLVREPRPDAADCFPLLALLWDRRLLRFWLPDFDDSPPETRCDEAVRRMPEAGARAAAFALLLRDCSVLLSSI